MRLQRMTAIPIEGSGRAGFTAFSLVSIRHVWQQPGRDVVQATDCHQLPGLAPTHPMHTTHQGVLDTLDIQNAITEFSADRMVSRWLSLYRGAQT